MLKLEIRIRNLSPNELVNSGTSLDRGEWLEEPENVPPLEDRMFSVNGGTIEAIVVFGPEVSTEPPFQVNIKFVAGSPCEAVPVTGAKQIDCTATTSEAGRSAVVLIEVYR